MRPTPALPFQSGPNASWSCFDIVSMLTIVESHRCQTMVVSRWPQIPGSSHLTQNEATIGGGQVPLQSLQREDRNSPIPVIFDRENAARPSRPLVGIDRKRTRL